MAARSCATRSRRGTADDGVQGQAGPEGLVHAKSLVLEIRDRRPECRSEILRRDGRRRRSYTKTRGRCPKSAPRLAFPSQLTRTPVNPLHPAHMSCRDRLDEVCRLLARGLIRLRMRDAAQVTPPHGESSLHFPPDRSVHANPTRRRTAWTDSIPARVAALRTAPVGDLRAEWRTLFDSEPPPFNRRYLENRIAYRIQELAYGGLKPETLRRLEALGEQYDNDNRDQPPQASRRPAGHRHPADPRVPGDRAHA